jgi:arylsulfatase A-like enzyme
MWFAGGGTKAGAIIGETDELGFNPVEDRAHVHDIHATILHLLGLDHHQLAIEKNGLDEKLTGVAEASVIQGVLA